MSAAPITASPGGRLSAWTLTALRAVLGIILGLVVTFSSGHSAAFGLVAFGVYGVVAGIGLVVGAILVLDQRARGTFLVQGALTVVAGAVALGLVGGGVIALVGIVSAWAILTGALELVSGLRARGRQRSARDWTITGTLTVLLGVGFLVVPPGYSQSLGGLEKVSGTLTASVVMVGILGAWGILTGVLQAIAAVSLHADERPRAEQSA